jgi:hypothetical protein
MKKSEKYICDALKKDIEESLQIMVCKHKWVKDSLGYLCSKCTHYTGTNEELNRIIRNELSRRRKV